MNRILISICLLLTLNSFAQSPKAIEADLLKSFKKIGYWTNYKYNGKGPDSTVLSYDSLEQVNALFSKHLEMYTYLPLTNGPMVRSLRDAGFGIFTSKDGLFRIYSWDTGLGGTMHSFRNVLQYKHENKISSISVAGTATGEQQYVYDYSKLYTLKTTDNKTYYLAIYYGIFSSSQMGAGIRVFSIEDGKLNDATKIIKTENGLQGKIAYDYNIFSISKKDQDEDIHYDQAARTISIPVIVNDGYVTNRRIIYKFNGKYFEKVKN